MPNSVFHGLLGLGVCAVLSGCGPGAKTETPAQHKEQTAGGHEHPEQGPHGGHLIVLGNDRFHAELLHGEPAHTVTVHLLDAAGGQPVASDQPTLTIQLFQEGKFVDYELAAVRAGEAAGASEFKVVDEKLCDRLSHAEEVKGRLKVTIGGKALVGSIEHSAHDHEEDPDHDEGAGHRHE